MACIQDCTSRPNVASETMCSAAACRVQQTSETHIQHLIGWLSPLLQLISPPWQGAAYASWDCMQQCHIRHRVTYTLGSYEPTARTTPQQKAFIGASRTEPGRRPWHRCWSYFWLWTLPDKILFCLKHLEQSLLIWMRVGCCCLMSPQNAFNLANILLERGAMLQSL